MSDPYLYGPDPQASQTASDPLNLLSFGEVLRAAGMEEYQVEECLARMRRWTERWGSLVPDIRRTLVRAGFQQHRLPDELGGFVIGQYSPDEGVLVSWGTRCVPDAHEADPFVDEVEQAMHTALRAILTADGFTATIIPDEEDDAGCVLVTGTTPTRTP